MMRTSLSFLIMLLVLAPGTWAAPFDHALQVSAQRQGDTYLLSARFDTSLSQCAAYRYLTDYESATRLPGILESRAYREADNSVRVERTAEERILFMRIHLHSVMTFTEYPHEKLTFTQTSGDSLAFSGSWRVAPNGNGSTLYFEGEWTPDTLLPLFIIDHFAENDLARRFGEIARLAEDQRDTQSTACLRAAQLAQQ